MEISFKSNKLKKQLGTVSGIKQNFGVNAKRVSTRLDEILSSPTLAVLMQIPAANCHPLKGSRTGEWAVDVSANFRMIFEIDHEFAKTGAGEIDPSKVSKIRILEIADYHN
jgi:proteic killer suppression protein